MTPGEGRAPEVRRWLDAGTRHARTHGLKYATALVLLALLLAIAGVALITRPISQRSTLDSVPRAGRTR